MDNFGIDHGIPVNLARRVLELFEIPVTINPARIAPLRRLALEDLASQGRGAGSLAESLLAFESAARLKRSRLRPSVVAVQTMLLRIRKSENHLRQSLSDT